MISFLSWCKCLLHFITLQDAVLLDGFNIKMDESAMTGETDLISKSSYEQACQKSAELLGETGGVGAEGKTLCMHTHRL